MKSVSSTPAISIACWRACDRRRPTTAPIDVVAEYDSDTKTAALYLGGNALDIATILHGSAMAGWQMEHGDGRLQVWADWAHDTLMQVRTEIDLRNLVMTTPQPITVRAKQTDRPARGLRPRRVRRALAANRKRLDDGSGRRRHIAAGRAVEQREYTCGQNRRRRQRTGDVRDRRRQSRHRRAGQRGDAHRRAAGSVAALVVRSRSGRRRAFLRAALRRACRISTWPPRSRAARGIRSTRFPASPASPVRCSAIRIRSRSRCRRNRRSASTCRKCSGSRSNFPTSPATSPFIAATTSWRIETDALDFEGAKYGGQLRGSVDLHDDGSKPSVDAYADRDARAGRGLAPVLADQLDAAEHGAFSRSRHRVRPNGRAAARCFTAIWPTGRSAKTPAVSRRARKSTTCDFPYLPDWPAAEHLRATARFRQHQPSTSRRPPRRRWA